MNDIMSTIKYKHFIDKNYDTLVHKRPVNVDEVLNHGIFDIEGTHATANNSDKIEAIKRPARGWTYFDLKKYLLDDYIFVIKLYHKDDFVDTQGAILAMTDNEIDNVLKNLYRYCLSLSNELEKENFQIFLNCVIDVAIHRQNINDFQAQSDTFSKMIHDYKLTHFKKLGMLY